MKRVGDPVDADTIYGPMHSQVGVENYLSTVQEAQKLGGKVEFGGKVRL
jgi:aldehyde dehydrogenase family 7 protein A1